MRHKAVVINNFWAGIISSLVVVILTGAFAFCKIGYDAQAEAAIERAVIKQQYMPLREADLPNRMTRIEETVRNTADDVEQINQKLDFLIQNQLREDREREKR